MQSSESINFNETYVLFKRNTPLGGEKDEEKVKFFWEMIRGTGLNLARRQYGEDVMISLQRPRNRF